MLTDLFVKHHQRYADSPVADWLIKFADWLVSAGYAHDPAHDHVRRLKEVLERWERFAPEAEFSVAELTTMFTSAKQQVLYRGTQHVFERFLADRRQLRVERDSNRFAPLLNAYRRHLVEVRGLAASTVSQHLSTVTSFLAQTVSPETSLQDLSREAVESFLGAVGQRWKRQSLQHPIAQLRAFLRYCHDRGEIRERLDTIDTPRTYRGELPPRALAWPLVEELLYSIDRSSPAGWRDYVILHLMAHYGLRPAEIVNLTIESIDWRTKTLHVEQCKTRSTLILPLSPQTLELFSDYLRWGRPRSPHRELFLRARTPAGPLKPTAIDDLYDKRSRKSGLPLQGSSPYCLRHSFAMRLLDCGVGIKVIGDLLGHRSLESTCVYLRLQTEVLREVALPLPLPSSARQGEQHGTH